MSYNSQKTGLPFIRIFDINEFLRSKQHSPEYQTLKFLVDLTEPMHAGMRLKDRYDRAFEYFDGFIKDPRRRVVPPRKIIQAAGQAQRLFNTTTLKNLPTLDQARRAIQEYNMVSPTGFLLPEEKTNPADYTKLKCGFASQSTIEALLDPKSIDQHIDVPFIDYSVYIAQSKKSLDLRISPKPSAHEVCVVAFPDYCLAVSYSDQQFTGHVSPEPQKLEFLMTALNKDAVKGALEFFYTLSNWTISKTRIWLNRRDVGIDYDL